MRELVLNQATCHRCGMPIPCACHVTVNQKLREAGYQPTGKGLTANERQEVLPLPVLNFGRAPGDCPGRKLAADAPLTVPSLFAMLRCEQRRAEALK